MKPKIAAIGTFDGVHNGHKSVIKVMTDYAREHDYEPVVITFSHHPLSLISPGNCPHELTCLEKKKDLLEQAGVTPMVLTFDDNLRNTTAADMMKRMYEKGVRTLVVGYDNTFGCDGINLSLEDYRQLGKETGIEVLSAPEVKNISSSRIRKAVAEGEIEDANEMLGRHHCLSGIVEKGNQIGHTLGYPTANILPGKGVATPKPGVYAAIVCHHETGNDYKAMVNVGTRPTITDSKNIVVEAHLFDFQGNLYGEEISVRFIKRIRDEEKFDSIQNLRQHLDHDAAEVLNLFKTIKS